MRVWECVCVCVRVCVYVRVSVRARARARVCKFDTAALGQGPMTAVVNCDNL